MRKRAILFGFLILCLLLLLWVVSLEFIIKPHALINGFTSIPRQLGLYVGPPLGALVVIHGFRSLRARVQIRRQEELREAEKNREERLAREEEERRAAALAIQRFSLEVLAAGAGVGCLNLGQIWDELQERGCLEQTLSTDPDELPSAEAALDRNSRVLGPMLAWLNGEWPIPVFVAVPEPVDPQLQATIEGSLAEALARGDGEGRPRIVDTLFSPTPDALFQQVFDFMERCPEVPAVLLLAEDGSGVMHRTHPEETSMSRIDGPGAGGEITETVVAVLVGRKDRVESMHVLASGRERNGRDPMTPYWERERASTCARAFTATEWLPKAWSGELIERFLGLPVLGCLHRPQYATFTARGAAIRAGAVKKAWRAALENLGSGGKLEHLFYDFGDVSQGRRIVPLSRAMAGLDPEFEVLDQGIDLCRCIGDTGAAAPLLGLALAVTASHREQGVAASVFLRREEGASLVMISQPPGPEEPRDCASIASEEKHVQV